MQHPLEFCGFCVVIAAVSGQGLVSFEMVDGLGGLVAGVLGNLEGGEVPSQLLPVEFAPVG